MNVRIVNIVKNHKLLLIVLMLAKVINANIVSLVHQMLIQHTVMIVKTVKVVMFVYNAKIVLIVNIVINLLIKNIKCFYLIMNK